MSIEATILDNGISANIATAAVSATFTGGINIDVDDLALASNTGATLIGWIRSATGAVARTIADWFDDQPSVMDFIPFAERVKLRLNTSTADMSPYIQAAVDAMGNGRSLRFPYASYRCLSKIEIGKGVETQGFTFVGEMGSYLEVAEMPNIYLDAASADTTLFELDQASGVQFLGLSLKGKGNTAGTYVITATDVHADIDLTLHRCTIGNAETIAKITGRGLNVSECSLVFATNGFELGWPSPFTSNGNTDHYPGSGMRAYRIQNNRIHGWSGGYLVKNEGANAHNIRSVQITGNYADTNIRMWKGHINATLVANNQVYNTRGGNGTLALFEIDADLNAVGGVVNHDLTITDNYFGGQLDDTYESGGSASVQDYWFATLGNFANLSGLKVTGNTLYRASRNGLTLLDVDNFDISHNTFRDVCLDGVRSLVLTGVTGAFVAGETVTGATSGATGVLAYPSVGTLRLDSVTGTFAAAETVTGGTSGATGTISTTSLTARYPIVLNSGDVFSRGYIGPNHFPTTHSGGLRQIIRTNGATVTDLEIAKQFFDPTKWTRDDYLANPYVNINDDSVGTYLLKRGNGLVAVQAATAATMETAIVSLKVSGTDSIQIVSDPAAVFSVATTGVLAGTTGTDTKINLSVVETAGVTTLYVENRRGGTRGTSVIELGVS